MKFVVKESGTDANIQNDDAEINDAPHSSQAHFSKEPCLINEKVNVDDVNDDHDDAESVFVPTVSCHFINGFSEIT